MDMPKPGEEFQVGSNYSGQVRHIASVVGEQRNAVTGEREIVVIDNLGYEQRVKANNNVMPKTDWFSS